VTVTIRLAGPADASTLLELIRGLAAYEQEPQAVVATAAELERQLASPRPPFDCLLAERQGPGGAAEALGFALFFANYSTWRGRAGIYLEDLFVRPEHRRRGVGRELLRRVARLAIERGCPRLDLAVLDWNRPALEFYRRLGAVALDPWRLHRFSGRSLARLAAGEHEERPPAGGGRDGDRSDGGGETVAEGVGGGGEGRTC
jgi:GNAT superfamily N-acetyltransferase